MTLSRFDRRLVLRGLGGAAGAYFLPSLSPRHARAAAPPKRLLIFFTQHGNPYPDWSMRRPGLTENAAWEFDLGGMTANEFSPIYRPLHPFRRKLLVLDTLSNAVCLEQNAGGGGHFAGPASIFTGSPITNEKSNRAQGASIDQIIAQKVFVSGGVRSIEMGSGRPHPAIWAGSGSALPIRTAGEVFSDVFANRNLGPPKPPSGGGTTEVTLSREEKLMAARKQVLDQAQARYREVAKRLTVPEKARLETHADLVSDLALSLADPSAGGVGQLPAATAGCSAPVRPAGGSMAADVKSMAALVGSAFACDLTRVASIQLAQMRTSEFGGPSGADVHQDIAHHGEKGSSTYQHMVKYYTRHAEHLATVLGVLDGIEEPDGSRVLDNTIVLWAPECGSWIHQTSHLPIVIAGGAGFKMGRYLHWGDIDPISRPLGGNGGADYSRVGPPITRLLVSVARQMGLSLDKVGTLDRAHNMSLTGPLDRLT